MRKIVCRGAFAGHLMDMVWHSEGKVNKKRTARMLITRVIVTILAMAMTVGMAPYPGRTAYAESNDGYEDNGDEGDLDDDFGNGDDSDDDSDVDPNATQYEWIENEDGTWTLIKTYYEDGQKTGSKEETRSQDGSQTVTVNKDENGTETETETYYDEDGVKTGSTEITTDEMGTPVKTVSKDADGNVTRKTVETVAMGENYFESSSLTEDGDGNVIQYEETRGDSEGNVTGTTSAYYMTDADGNQVYYTREADGEDISTCREWTDWSWRSGSRSVIPIFPLSF